MGKVKRIMALFMVLFMTCTIIPANTLNVEAATVKAKSVTLNKEMYTLKKGKTVQLKATVNPENTTQKKLQWSSSNNKIAKVSSKGKVTAKKNGTATITVKVKGTKIKDTCKIIVGTPVTKVKLNKTKLSLKPKKTYQLKATVSPSGATTKGVTWKSSNTKAATVNSKGKITAKKAGTTTITATTKDGTGKKAACKVTVGKPVTKIKLNKTKVTLKVGKTFTLKPTISPGNATTKTVSYNSSNKNVATVNSKGKITAKKAGTATITVSANDASGKQATCKVTVSPVYVDAIEIPDDQKTKTLDIGESFVIDAKVIPSNATNKNLVYSSNAARYVASVDKNGKVTARGQGTATITVASEDGKAVTTLDVIVKEPAVPVTKVKLSRKLVEFMLNSSPVQLRAKFTPKNATVQYVEWSSENPEVATVSDTGLVKPVSEGETVITAKALDGGYETKCIIQVKNGVSIGTSEELFNVLNSAEVYDVIEFTSMAEESFVIPEIENKDFTNTIIKFDAPNTIVSNNIDFGKIEINDVDTHTENVDNIINVSAEESRIVIGEGASVDLNLFDEIERVDVENNGTVKHINIETDGIVNITGISSQPEIPTTVEDEATINTSKALDIEANAKPSLILKAGSEGTSVKTDDEKNIPTVSGIGTVTVKVNDDEKIIIAEPTEEETGAGQINTFTGIVQTADKTPVAGAEVFMIPYRADFNMGDFDGSAEWKTTTDENGEYNIDSIPVGNYYLIIRRTGYRDIVQTCIFTTADAAGEVKINESVTMTTQEDEVESGSVSGVILDSVNGEPIAGLTIRIRAGQNNISGDTCAPDVTTDSDGKYIIPELEPGTYTIQVLDLRNVEDKYVTTSFNVYIESGKETTDKGTALSPVIENEQIRFVLTWGNQESGAPSDLDSHIVGPTVDGTGQFHVYYSERSYYNNEGAEMVNLDCDDTSWEGPETVTIYERTPGVYYYSIHDYSNGGLMSSKALAESGAKVEVYVGDRLLQTFNVPNKEGTLWNVCSFSTITNSITPINTMEYEQNSSNVGMNLYYGDLKITALETNEFVSEAVVSGSNVKIKTDGNLTDNLDKIVPIIAQEGATYQVALNEYGDCYITITGVDGIVREYRVYIEYDYKDLYLTGFETNDIVTGYEIYQQEDGYSYDEINLIMTNTDISANINKIVPLVAQQGATYEIVDDYGDYYLKLTAVNGVTRSYNLYARQDYGKLVIEGITSTNNSLSRVDIGSDNIDLYGSRQTFAEVKDSLVFDLGEDVVSYEIISDDDDEGRIILTRADGFTRTYYYMYYIDWGDLYISNVSSEHAAVSNLYYGSNYVELYLQDVTMSEEIARSLVFTYGNDSITGRTYQNEYGTWCHEYTDGNLTRTADIYANTVYEQDFSVISATYGERIGYVDIYSNSIEISGSYSDIQEAMNNISFEYGARVANVEFEMSSDSSSYGYLRLTRDDGVTRTYSVEYYKNYGNVYIDSVSSNLDYVTVEDWGSGYINLYITDHVFTEEIGEALNITYGSSDVTESFEYDEANEQWYLNISDGIITRKCNIYIYYDYSDEFCVSGMELDWTENISGYNMGYDYLMYYVTEDATYEEVINATKLSFGTLVTDYDYEIYDGKANLILKGENERKRIYSIYLYVEYGDLEITEITITSSEIYGYECDRYNSGESYINLYVSEPQASEIELRKSFTATFGNDTTTGKFNEDGTTYTLTDSATGRTRVYNIYLMPY